MPALKAANFAGFPFYVAFCLPSAGKGNGFRWVSLFALPFCLPSAGKGSGFRRVSLFTLPFCLPSAGKGSGFCRVSLFALPFRLLANFKGNGFRRVSLFTLPFCRRPYKHANSAPQRSVLMSNMILRSAPLLRSFRVPTNMRTPCHSAPFL